jgi:hypothetical protein
MDRNIRRLPRGTVTMAAEYGFKCRDFDPGCIICQGWRLFEQTGKVPADADVQALVDKELGNT